MAGIIRDMGIYTLRCDTLVKRSLQETFDFFKNPANLGKLTPAWLNFQIVTKDVAMRQGAEFEYVIHWLGLPMHWRSIITEYNPPYGFADEQAKGPYSSWQHHHTFAETADGVVVGDHVKYSLPLGPLGAIAHAVMVKRQLTQTFEFRGEALEKIFPGATRRISGPTIT
jgi:ligand-binding SRPBCC domain-containing protein